MLGVLYGVLYDMHVHVVVHCQGGLDGEHVSAY